jgi:mono/diheme cytochrome c family protein
VPRLASPRAIALATVALALALDVGRSVYARLGFREPYQVWDPPAPYARIPWPPGADVPADAPLGARVFARRCAVCHGPRGEGNGPAAPSLHPRPRDLTAGELKYRTTPPGTPPAAADLLRIVRDGLAASAMPYFRDLLSDEEQRAVVEHVRSLMGAAGADAAPVRVPARPPADAASVRRGEALYAQACASCHGADLRGGEPYEDRPGSRVIARDLTAPWTFRGGASPEAIFVRLTTGMIPGPMPSYADALSARDRWDLVDYVASRARPPPWEAGGRLDGPGQSPDPLRRGDYLVRAEMCSLCHTQIDATGIYREEGWFLAGGMRVAAGPHGFFVSRNLTSDVETGIGGETEAELAHTIRNGRDAEGALNPWGMPWWFFHAFTELDAVAIATRLKALPAVRHRVPDPLELGFVETVARKLVSPLPAAVPVALSYAHGDFADPEARPETRAAPAHALVLAQRVVLVLGALLYAALRLRRRNPGRLPRSGREAPRPSRGLRALGVALLALLGLAAWVTARLPQIVPPDRLAAAIQGRIPDPPAEATPERAALLARGRYLFTVTSCAFCHGPDGAGGQKVSWKAFGTLWTRNVTPDLETGIGAWSDAEVARAIRSGISRDGRALHWQGMTWDLLSNLDEEDVRAVVAYLRTLPPVRKAIPPARPPADDDCDVYTFFLRGELDRPGCR